MSPRIFLIHALAESVAPIHASFRRHWPEAFPFDLLDTALSTDLAAAGQLTPAIRARFLALGRYAAAAEGAGGRTAAILFTCSAFGPAIEAVKADLSVPVLKPNEAAFAAALKRGSRIGLLVTFEPSLAPLGAELRDMAARAGRPIDLQAAVVPEALAALKADDGDRHDRLIAEAASRLSDVDALILGQFSMARAAARVTPSCTCPVFTTPDTAVSALKDLVAGGAAALRQRSDSE
ncbi:MAG TPA: aspartate/glutamate racemase family protein [Dongiaceae bacterium]|nr:aspartate/glutamate racemase family protein [Dongiaceae bacterium]